MIFQEVLNEVRKAALQNGMRDGLLKATVTGDDTQIVVTFQKDPAVIEAEKLRLQAELEKLS